MHMTGEYMLTVIMIALAFISVTQVESVIHKISILYFAATNSVMLHVACYKFYFAYLLLGSVLCLCAYSCLI